MAAEPLPQTAPITLGWLWAQLDETHQKAALKNIGDWGVWYFETIVDTGIKAMGLVTPSPADRLGFFKYVKTPAEWEEQRMKYPDDFEADQADFERLLAREAKGDLVATVPASKQQPASQPAEGDVPGGVVE